MRKWNKEAAPNNNMTSADIEFSMRNNKENIEFSMRNNKENIEFSEELADGGERNERYEGQKNKEH